MERTGLEQWKAREVARLLSLVETERRYYQEIVAMLPMPLVVLAADRSIISANRAFRKLLGVRNEELRGKTIEELIASDDLVDHIRAAHVNGDLEPFFVDMGERAYRIALVPSQGWDDEGEPETVMMIEDMTEVDRRRVARGTAPAGLPAIIWRAEWPTLGFQSVGGSAEEMTGYAPPHWTSTFNYFWDRIHPEDLPQVRSLYQTVLDRGGDATAEFRMRTAMGEPIWLRESIRVSELSGSARAVAGVATNVSRRKQLEAQLLAASRVDAIQGISARLAHDMNNPLMIINGYSEDLLGSFPKQDARREDVSEILSASRRLTELTSHLLSYARQQTQPSSKINLSQAVADLEIKLQQATGRSLVTTDPGNGIIALADPEQILDILSTIAIGTLGLTQSPSSLHVVCHTDTILEHIGPATLPPGNYARVDFRATGLGLADTDRQGTAFEMVLPAKDSRAGAAMALARAYATVREWGGDITDLGDGQGALLVLYLPAPHVAVETPHAPRTVETHTPPPIPVEEPVAAVTPEPESEPLRETILLVDDEPGIRGLVRRILRRENYNVIEAGSGEEALAIALQHAGPIHVLLSDVMMPGMSGPRLAQSVQGAFPSVKVIFISGYSESEPAQKVPGSSFLQKPFTMPDLLRVVRQAIES